MSKAAQKTAADIIVFCGVKFMGESAAILNPEKKVLMPDLTADCAMAHMVQLEKSREIEEKHMRIWRWSVISIPRQKLRHIRMCV